MGPVLDVDLMSSLVELNRFLAPTYVGALFNLTTGTVTSPMGLVNIYRSDLDRSGNKIA